MVERNVTKCLGGRPKELFGRAAMGLFDRGTSLRHAKGFPSGRLGAGLAAGVLLLVLSPVRFDRGQHHGQGLAFAAAETAQPVSAQGVLEAPGMAPAPPASARPDPAGADPGVPGSVVVRLAAGRRSNIVQLSRDHQLSVAETLSKRLELYAVLSSAGVAPQDLAATLALDERVAEAYVRDGTRLRAAPFGLPGWGGAYTGQAAELDVGMVETLGSGAPGGGGDSASAKTFGLDSLQSIVRSAHDLTKGEGSVVAVLDTGIALRHPTLKDVVLPRSRLYDFIDDDNNPSEVYPSGLGAADATDGSIAGHGTFVAGIVHLIAPAADLMPLRVLDPYGAGDPALVAEAIREADDNGANVIVLGFVADTSSAAIVDAIHDATADGVLVVAPAGDSGAQGVWAQADDACTIGVVALAPLHVKASFASFGLKAGMSAPGESIVSTLPDPDHPGDETYGTWSGSSFAAPFVAGQAALIRSLDPTLGPRAVSAVIATTATGIDLLNPLFAGLLGAGAPHVTRSAYYLHDGHSPDLGDALISAACADG